MIQSLIDLSSDFMDETKIWPTLSDWVITLVLAGSSFVITFTPIRSPGIYLLGLLIAVIPLFLGLQGFLIGLALSSSSMFYTRIPSGLLYTSITNPDLLHIAGFYLTLPECLTIGAMVAVLGCYRKLLYVFTVNYRIHLIVVILAMVIPFIIIGALQGKANGYVIWANGLRGLLPSLMLLYPLACLSRSQVGFLARRFTALLIVNSIAWLLLGTWGHGFFLIGFISATVTALALTQGRPLAWLMLLPLMIWSRWNQMSFTLQITIVAPVLMGLLLFARWKFIRRLSIAGLYFCSVILLIAIFGVAHDIIVQPDVWKHMANMDISPGISPTELHENINIIHAIKFKIYDRMGIWIPALTELMNNPLQLATGRPIIVIGGGNELIWEVGAHNVLLEWLLNLGVIPGLWMCAFTVGCIIFVIQFGRKFRYDLGAIWATLAALSIIPGIILGQYPIQSVCGFAFWLVIGLCMKIEAETIITKRRLLEYVR
jgi:hypothetical protein